MSQGYGDGYDTVDDAAAAAMMRLSQQPNVADQEYSTIIFKSRDDGKYYRSDFQTQGKWGTSSWDGAVPGQIVGIVHNHPGDKGDKRYVYKEFSKDDVASVRNAIAEHPGRDVRGYMTHIGVQQQGKDYVRTNPLQDEQWTYIPGVTPEKKAGPALAGSQGGTPLAQKQQSNNYGTTPGSPFLAQYPINELKAIMATNLMRNNKIPAEYKRDFLLRLQDRPPEGSNGFFGQPIPPLQPMPEY